MILDPRTIEPTNVTGSISLSEHASLSQELVNFGYVINKDNLFPGDLILTRSIEAPEKFSRFTQSTQKRQFASNYEWTHAAVYYHDWIVLEATPEEDVSSSSILDIMKTHLIMVRRGNFIINEINNGKIDSARSVGLTIALEAALHQKNAKYGMISAFLIYLGSKRNKKRNANETSMESIICSGLYAKCYHIATGKIFLTPKMQRDEEPVTPALLANTRELVTINVGWSKLIP